MDAPYICGRCGYELTGVIDSWESECPLEGQCSECGSEFRWRDIFHIDRLNKRWLVEHASTRMGLIKRIPTTIGMAALPWCFWLRLSMQAKIGLRKAAVASLLLVILAHLGVGGYATASAIRYEYQIQSWYTPPEARIAPLGWSSVPPIVAKVIFGELVYVDLQAAALPGTESTNGIMNNLVGKTFPVAKHSTLNLGFTGKVSPPLFLFGVAFNGTWVGLLGLLPTTRRRCKLRWAHILRAMVYGLAGSAVFSEYLRLAEYIDMQISVDIGVVASVLTMVGWSTLWWSSAVIFGWKLRHRWWVAAVFAFTSFLALLVTMGLISAWMVEMG